MTTSANNQKNDQNSPLFYPVKTDGTGNINQGDLVYFDTSAKVILALDTDAHAAYLAGVALQQVPLTVYSTAQYPQGGIEVATHGIFEFSTTAGDTYNDGDAVYIGADAQTITNTAGGSTHKVGYVKLAPGQSAVAYAAGLKIPVIIAPAFPFAGI